MSDLKDRAPDLHGAPSARIAAANRPARDRRPGFSDLVIACSLLFAACAHPPTTTAERPVQRAEIWVDAFSQPGGDGTREKPLKALPLQLPVADVHVRSGLYAGPFVVPEGARVEGHGEVVLTAEGTATTVTATSATLRGLTIQGGAVGLAARDVTLEQVTFSGQRTTAAQIGQALTARGLRVQASVEGVNGFVAKDAKVELHDARFTGGFGRALDVSGGELRLTGAHFEGAKYALRALDAVSTLEAVDAAGGSSTALLFAGGAVNAKGVEVHGYEYGVQLSRGVTANWSDVSLRAAAQACMSTVQATRLTLERAHFSRCGPGGALAMLDSTSTVRELTVKDSAELGVFVRKGGSTLVKLEVQGVRGGDALHVRDAAVRLDDVVLRDTSGAGMHVGAVATVTGTGVQIERADGSALFVERGSSLTLESLLVRGGRGPAVLVPDAATVTLGTLSVSGGDEQPIYAECDRGARVEVKRLESTLEQLPSRCVTTR